MTPDAGYLIPISPLRLAILQSLNDWASSKSISLEQTVNGLHASAISADGTKLEIGLSITSTPGSSPTAFGGH